MRELFFFERWGFSLWFGVQSTSGRFIEKRRGELWIGKLYAVWG